MSTPGLPPDTSKMYVTYSFSNKDTMNLFILCICSTGPLVSTFLAPFLVLDLAFLRNSLFHIFCSGVYLACFLFKFVSRQLVLTHWRPELLSCSDIYYLAFLKDPPTRKILVYTVYVAELVQTILLSQMAFKEFAAGFGSLEALGEVGNFWFAVPILSSTGMSSWSLFSVSLQAN